MLSTVLAIGLSTLSPNPATTPALCESCRLLARAERADPEVEARRQELRRRINELTTETRGMKTDFPVGALMLSYVGYVFAPFLLIGLFVTAIAPFIGGSTLLVGLALTALGVGGVVALVVGLTSGFKAQEEMRARRDALVNERLRLEEELKSLPPSSGGAPPSVSPLAITVFTFS
jgi:hypothetical protein